MKYFIAQEFIPPDIYRLIGDLSIKLMDPRILETADAIRERYGPTTINNWHSHGSRQWSGLRIEGCSYGTAKSQHRFGKAIDCLVSGMTAEEIRQDILKNPLWFPHIRGIELGVSWLHVDCRDGDHHIAFRS